MARKKKQTKAAKRVKRAFQELEARPPAILAATRRKKGAKAANRQRVAIAFAKAGLGRKKKSKKRGK